MYAIQLENGDCYTGEAYEEDDILDVQYVPALETKKIPATLYCYYYHVGMTVPVQCIYRMRQMRQAIRLGKNAL